ncbi:MAG: dihydropteroate synthase [Bacteroidales bacterium]|nr:dihydropteroate synthase [Clostridium sp.]MCM1203182.1 dihydropteroate synthase [Bacteroidales bacterium]
MKIGNREFDFERHFYMMGILNVTPDSFSDGGRYNEMDRALFRAERLVEEGADILDVGGESTRPNHVPISAEEEMERVCPVITRLKEEFGVPVSLDTYKPEVAEAGIQAGVDLINDIWGLKWDNHMAEIIAKADIACCLMHNRKPQPYTDLIEDVLAELSESVNLALNAGIGRQKIILDPGIGFAKGLEENLCLMHHLGRIKELGYPVLLGTSRKSMIGLTLGLPVEEREEGTLATSVMGLLAGCSLFRVHDVKTNIRGLRMAEAILQAK